MGPTNNRTPSFPKYLDSLDYCRIINIRLSDLAGADCNPVTPSDTRCVPKVPGGACRPSLVLFTLWGHSASSLRTSLGIGRQRAFCKHSFSSRQNARWPAVCPPLPAAQRPFPPAGLASLTSASGPPFDLVGGRPLGAVLPGFHPFRPGNTACGAAATLGPLTLQPPFDRYACTAAVTSRPRSRLFVNGPATPSPRRPQGRQRDSRPSLCSGQPSLCGYGVSWPTLTLAWRLTYSFGISFLELMKRSSLWHLPGDSKFLEAGQMPLPPGRP